MERHVVSCASTRLLWWLSGMDRADAPFGPGLAPNREPRRKTRVKLFKCQNCGQVVYFENTKCGVAAAISLATCLEAMTVTALEPDPDNDAFRALAAPKTSVRLCDNAAHEACNWLVSADSAGDPLPRVPP